MNNNTEQAGANAPGFRCGIVTVTKKELAKETNNLDAKKESEKEVNRLEITNSNYIEFIGNSLDNEKNENFFIGNAEEINSDIMRKNENFFIGNAEEINSDIMRKFDLYNLINDRTTDYAASIRSERNTGENQLMN